MDWFTFLSFVAGMFLYEAFAHKWLIRRAKREIIEAITKEELVFIIHNHARLED